VDAQLAYVCTTCNLHVYNLRMCLCVYNLQVEYDSRFRLYLQTKLSNPHYKPEIAAQTTLVNFCVTEKVGGGVGVWRWGWGCRVVVWGGGGGGGGVSTELDSRMCHS